MTCFITDYLYSMVLYTFHISFRKMKNFKLILRVSAEYFETRVTKKLKWSRFMNVSQLHRASEIFGGQVKFWCYCPTGQVAKNLILHHWYTCVNPNVSLKQQKINFSVHSRKFKTQKILFCPICESLLCSRNAKISQIFRLAKVSAPKVIKYEL